MNRQSELLGKAFTKLRRYAGDPALFFPRGTPPSVEVNVLQDGLITQTMPMGEVDGEIRVIVIDRNEYSPSISDLVKLEEKIYYLTRIVHISSWATQVWLSPFPRHNEGIA